MRHSITNITQTIIVYLPRISEATDIGFDHILWVFHVVTGLHVEVTAHTTNSVLPGRIKLNDTKAISDDIKTMLLWRQP